MIYRHNHSQVFDQLSQQTNKKKDIFRAWHVTAPQEHVPLVQAVLGGLYFPDNKSLPLYLRLIFVPSHKQLHTQAGIDAYKKAAQLQLEWMQTAQILSSRHVHALDTPHPAHHMTLRDILALVPPKGEPTQQLFHDMKQAQETTIFSVQPQHREEAQRYLKGIIPFTKKYFNDNNLDPDSAAFFFKSSSWHFYQNWTVSSTGELVNGIESIFLKGAALDDPIAAALESYMNSKALPTSLPQSANSKECPNLEDEPYEDDLSVASTVVTGNLTPNAIHETNNVIIPQQPPHKHTTHPKTCTQLPSEFDPPLDDDGLPHDHGLQLLIGPPKDEELEIIQALIDLRSPKPTPPASLYSHIYVVLAEPNENLLPPKTHERELRIHIGNPSLYEERAIQTVIDFYSPTPHLASEYTHIHFIMTLTDDPGSPPMEPESPK